MFQRRTPRILPTIIFLLGLALAMAPLRAQAPASQPGKVQRFFWKITSPTTEVYFLGSVHVATDDMYPLPAEIEAAYKGSKTLVVEADVTKANQLALAMQVMQQGMYAQGDALDKHISADSMKALRAYCQTAGMPAEMLTTMKPVMAAMTVEALFMEKEGLATDKGIDLHFLTQANDAKDKTIAELESADFQVKLLFSIDDKLAEKWLNEMLKDSSKDELDKAIKAWKEGDDKTLIEQMTQDEKTDPDAAKMNDLLIYQRNGGMAKKIDDLLPWNWKAPHIHGATHDQRNTDCAPQSCSG